MSYEWQQTIGNVSLIERDNSDIVSSDIVSSRITTKVMRLEGLNPGLKYPRLIRHTFSLLVQIYGRSKVTANPGFDS